MITAKYIGEDDWNQGLYKGTDGKMYVEVDGVLHHMTKEGEPISPARNVKKEEPVKEDLKHIKGFTAYLNEQYLVDKLMNEAVEYSPEDIKKVLWNSFKTHAKGIKYIGTDNQGNYNYEITPEASFGIDQANDILGELDDTTLFDIEVASDGNMKISYFAKQDAMAESNKEEENTTNVKSLEKLQTYKTTAAVGKIRSGKRVTVINIEPFGDQKKVYLRSEDEVKDSIIVDKDDQINIIPTE